MQKQTFTVLMAPDGDLDTDPVELTVTPLLCDQVRAEVELRQRGLTLESANVTFLGAMTWAALAREGRTELKFDAFTKACYDVKRERETVVDPTQPAASIDSA